MAVLYKNKGEWAEMYLLFYLLGNGYVTIRDPFGNSPDKELPIEGAVRDSSKGLIRFQLQESKVRVSAEEFTTLIDQYEFSINAEKLKNELLAGSGSFSLSPKLVEFMQRCGIDQPTAKNLPETVDGVQVGGKCDILLKYHDPRSGSSSAAGFSIKSAFACPATLQNGSFPTNFEYELQGLNRDSVFEINSIHGRRKRRNGEYTADVFSRCRKILDCGAKVVQLGPVKYNDKPSVFELNLTIIDSALPSVLSDVIELHYFSDDRPTLLAEMPEKLAEHRPIIDKQYDIAFYRKKLKDYLYACFAGMVPTKRWTGHSEVDGGYLVIDPSFDVFAYLSTDSDGFKEYLLKNTRLEHADCGKRRSDYGTIIIGENGVPRIRLNLQIRFVSMKNRAL